MYSYSQIIAATILDVGISSELTNWYHPLRLLVEGKPHVIMWYAFMLIGLYVVTPIINWINSIVSNKMWYKLSIVLFCYSIVVHYTCSLSWILQFAEWIGYYMMGYSIRKICEDKTVSKICRRMLLVIGVVVLLINYILCLHGVSEVFAGESYFSFCNILATLLIFTGISQMQIRHEHAVVSKIAKNTLWIYMLHILFIDPVFQIWGRIFKVLPSAIFILIWATLVLFLCMSSLSMYRGVISVLSRGKEIKNE